MTHLKIISSFVLVLIVGVAVWKFWPEGDVVSVSGDNIANQKKLQRF